MAAEPVYETVDYGVPRLYAEIPPKPPENLFNPQWKNERGRTITEWVVGKMIKLSVKCGTTVRNRAVVHFYIHEKSQGSIDHKITRCNSGEAVLEWTYNNTAQWDNPPEFYFEAKTSGGAIVTSSTLKMTMEINLLIIDKNNKIIRNAPISIKQNSLESEVQSNRKGEYKKAKQIPAIVTVGVTVPFRRIYRENLEIYTRDVNDNEIDLRKIDGSELIEINVNKRNVIKLPVRFLDQSNTNIVATTQTGRQTFSEYSLIVKVLGNRYFLKTIDIKSIQIFKFDQITSTSGNPTAKQMREVLNHYNIPVPPSFQNMTDADIESMYINDRGMSLPNGIIYLPNIFPANNGRQLNARLVHEVFHQYQYARHGKKKALKKLMDEMDRQINDMINYADEPDREIYNPYDYMTLSGQGIHLKIDILSLGQITTFEGQAQFIEDFSLAYLNYRNSNLNDYRPAMTNRIKSGITANVF